MQSILSGISGIRYRFTPCGATGNRGPTHSACVDYYSSIGTSTELNRLLFNIKDYRGAQGFQVPRDGLYNITVVGASGGRGICNVQGGGLGVLSKVQTRLTRDIELLIMVGQQGTKPCDVILNTDPAYTQFCNSLPTSDVQAGMCNSTWVLQTRNHDTLFYDIFGGGGGGGASMIRARNRSIGAFDGLPIVISGGGGGSPAQLYYDIVKVINVDNFLLPSEASYIRFLNGKTSNSSNYAVAGSRGIRAENNRTDSFIAGAGGGFNPTNLSSTEMDGKSFSNPLNFAEGGLDCAQIQRQTQTSGIPFFRTVGGFGGGGGGCAEGGGGGGYTGGSVLREGVTVPGGGGFSYIGSGNVTNIEPSVITFLSGNHSGDGYVEIIEADCGCVHDCLIYEGGELFECTCPEDASLGPDCNDCYLSK